MCNFINAIASKNPQAFGRIFTIEKVSDISWHGLEGLQDGYISVLADLSFHGVFQTAHSYADVADDMIGKGEYFAK